MSDGLVSLLFKKDDHDKKNYNGRDSNRDADVIMS